ncbi:deoxycytidyl transferase [Linnemannia zychae]|nr:deoxycytidyl transferase [Linnemannia zychae]
MERDTPHNPYEAIGFGDFGKYFKNKKIKLQLQQDEIADLANEDLPQIFEGVIVYVNGYTDPPIHEIRNMIVQRGGEFTQFLAKSSITHIIASNLTQAKMKENYKVAKPEWVVESVKANKLLPWHNYSTIRIPKSLVTFRTVSESETTQSSTPILLLTGPKESLLGGQSSYQTQTPSNSLISPQDASFSVQVQDYSSNNNPEKLNNTISEDNGMVNDIRTIEETQEQGIEAALENIEGEDSFFENLDLDQFEFELTPPQHASIAETSSRPLLQVSSGSSNAHLLPQLSAPADRTAKVEYKRVAFNPYTRAGLPSMMPLEGSNNTMKTSEIDGSQIEIDLQDKRHPTLIELSVPWNRLNSSVQPGFVEKFYQSSRLHYLSAWKAKLRDITAKIQKDRPPIESKGVQKTIMHIDFDCFFASVATRGKPDLQVKPIAVAHGAGGSTSNSEIASCNYLAREFGVKNGMQLLKARTLCPDLVVAPYEFQQYEDISIEFYKILLGYADELQAVSVDEALVDITSKCLPSWNSEENGDQVKIIATQGTESLMAPAAFALKVREEIFLATGCHASVGIGPNILLAKLSTKRAKPHGQYIWPSAPGSIRTLEELQGAVPDLIEDLDQDSNSQNSSNTSFTFSSTYEPPPVVRNSTTRKEPIVKDLPGVGYKISQDLLERLNVRTLHQLQQVPRDDLQRICGMKTGDLLYNSCRGIDESTISSDREKARQSVSAEISWGVRFENHQQLDVFMRDLAQEVSKRLKEINKKGKSIVMKIMKRKEFVKGFWKHLGHGPVDQFARTGQLPLYTDDPDLIANEALRLLNFFKFDVLDIRGLGIQVLKLNNNDVNTVSRSAFVFPESKNQTTLTTAMFQRKTVAPEIIRPIHHASTDSQDLPQQALIEQHAEQGKPNMEIDRATFKELPKDIQEELLREYKLVFNNENTVNTSNCGTTAVIEEAIEDTNAVEQINSRQNELPPWSQLDPLELMSLSTPLMRNALKEYAELKQTTRDQRQNVESSAEAREQHNAIPIVPSRANLKTKVDNMLGSSILPAPSKLDKSVLQELPPDIRAEIEQEYTHIKENHELIRKLAQPGSSRGTNDGAAVNTEAVYRIKVPTATVGYDNHSDQGSNRGKIRGRGATRCRPRGSRGRGRGRGQIYDRPEDLRRQYRDDYVHRETSEAIAIQAQVPKDTVSSKVPDLDVDFLAALPNDIRAEIEAAHRLEVIKSRRRQKDELAAQRDAATTASSRQGGIIDCTEAIGHHNVSILERPMLSGIRDVGELRVLITDWVRSTLVEQHRLVENLKRREEYGNAIETTMVLIDEGPNPDDVQLFIDFIVRVIVMERDLDRVRMLLRYLQRRIKENEQQAEAIDPTGRQGQQLVAVTWQQALMKILGVTRHLVAQMYGGSFDID